MEEDSTLERKY